MYRLIECLTQEHNYWLMSVAALVCVSGSGLTVVTLRRVLSATGTRKRVQMLLSSLITGATIWSTHFVAMLAYDPGVPHGFDGNLTALSLVVAILGMITANGTVSYAKGRKQYVLAGTLFGLTVSVMHFVGMAAFQIPGEIIIYEWTAATATLFGILLGILSYHRILFPVTRYCWLGGLFLMVLSILFMHFTAMIAFEIQLDSAILVPAQILPDDILGLTVLTVVAVIMFGGFSAISIETNLEREAVATLEHTMLHDHLTGLPNRQHLKSRLKELDRMIAEKPGLMAAVLAIDLDHFTQINDIHGHSVGDVVLREIADRLTDCIKSDPNEFIARINGDEFVAIKTNLLDEADALIFGDRLLGRITSAVRTENCTVATTASLGLATTLTGDLVSEELLRKANLAMFRAKQDFETSICAYDPEMDLQIVEKLMLIDDLRNAIAQKEFNLVFQLQNRANSREAMGFEVLLRWNHPIRGYVPPDEFIPLAEDTGLIQDIGLWVLRTACAEAATWRKPWSIAVNVAPQQLAQPAFLENLSDILLETGLHAERLELEVTEASVIYDQSFTLKVLKDIKKLGVRIAMDDFGTGYSSLATLQIFPFDKIKIDRRFVTDLHRNRKRAAIVRSTVSLGEAFGIPVLAEGVETEEELSFLESLGIDYMQGFFFGLPLSTQDVRKLVNPEQKRAAS